MTAAQKRKREKLEFIKGMYLSGSSREEIAAAAGYTVLTVGKYLGDLGLLHRQTSKEKTIDIIRLSDEGRKLDEISKAVGISIGTISRILGENGRGRRIDHGENEEPVGLITENTVFAVYKPNVYSWFDRRSGINYLDVTELISRR